MRGPFLGLKGYIMKKRNKDYIKWILRLSALVFTLTLGFCGYYYYYKNVLVGGSVLSQTIFSTIRLFAASFDLNYEKAAALSHGVWLIRALEAAKWVAIFLTGNVIFRLIRPFLSKFLIALREWRWRIAKKGVIIVGNNDNNKMIYRSVPDRAACALLVSCDEECEELWTQNINAIAADNIKPRDEEAFIRGSERKINRALKSAVEHKKACTVIINTQNEQANLHIAQQAAACVRAHLEKNYPFMLEKKEQALARKKEVVDILKNIRIFVFGERTYEAVYLSLQKTSFGILKYINKYHLTATDFVNEHTLLEHMDKTMFNKHVRNGCVSKELALNTVLVGFGQTNREILRVSFANNQFVEEEAEGIAQLKKVNYHIFERTQKCFDKNLNDTLFRYKNEFEEALKSNPSSAEEYFDISDFPADIRYYCTDVFEETFYRQLRDICGADSVSLTQVIIAIGSDLKNMDLAHRLASKKSEWGLENVHIYAKVRQNISEEISKLFSTKEYQLFGNEEQLVYCYKKIHHNDLEELAINRNLMYEYEQAKKRLQKVSVSNLQIRTHYQWYVEMDNIKRLSNIYSILSLRLKLQLLGLDYVKEKGSATAGKPLENNAAYFSIYAGKNPPKVDIPVSEAMQKDIYSYLLAPSRADFCAENVRANLTIQEHYRWNAFMISCGFVPQSKAAAFINGPKDYIHRRHSNLSAFEGLFAFRKEMAEYRHTSEEQEDVIKYDYQLMDDAWWFLHSKDYQIFERWQ